MSGRARRLGAWGVGALAVAAAGLVTGFVPTDDDIQAPFVVEASVGGGAVSVGELSVRVQEVRSSTQLTIEDDIARSNWVMVTLEVTGTGVIDRATEPKLSAATLHLGERSYSASARPDQTAVGMPLVAGLPTRLDVVFEIAEGDVASTGVLEISPRRSDDRLAHVLEVPLDLANVQRVERLSPRAPEWVRP